MSILKIKDISKGDFKYIWQIQKNAFRKDKKKIYSPYYESYEKFLKRIDKYICKVIILKKEIIGALFLKKLDKEGEYKLSRIYIIPKFQNKGLGTSIVREINKFIIGIKNLYLETPEENKKSQKFYEKNNFIITKILYIEKNFNTILYKKEME